LTPPNGAVRGPRALWFVGFLDVMQVQPTFGSLDLLGEDLKSGDGIEAA